MLSGAFSPEQAGKIPVQLVFVALFLFSPFHVCHPSGTRLRHDVMVQVEVRL